MKKIKQGQTRWKAILYEPGKIEGYDDCHVAAVYSCRVNKVENGTVHFDFGNGPYLCTAKHWYTKQPTYRKAWAEAQKMIAEVNKGV